MVKQQKTQYQLFNTVKINYNQSENIVVISYIIYLFLEISREYYINMSSIPQGAFAACKLRDMNEKEAQMARLRYDTEQNKHSKSNQQLEYGADKYHEKLMNSIWGLYNRYSPHNIKRNEYVQTEQGYYIATAF